MYYKIGDAICMIILPEDDCNAVVDQIITDDYDDEYCLALDFKPEFVARLMAAGFLVMSANIRNEGEEPVYLLFPKLHTWRSALFFDNIHVKKSIRRFLSRYELRPDAEFDRIFGCCVKKHGSDWLTPPLVDCIKKIRRGEGVKRPDLSEGLTSPSPSSADKPPDPVMPLLPTPYPYPAAFGLYRDDKLVAGDFGVVCGNVYTSYSGYYDEDNAGTAQLILTARYLQEHGFTFFDLGMPMEYKTMLGAEDIKMKRFVQLFRERK